MAPQKISFLSLVLLIVASIDSIRNLPASAVFGPSLIFFFLLAAVLFLMPVALVSAKLSAAFPEEGGVYAWVKLAFGENTAMAAVWLQWINTIVWYPTILSFIAGTLAYLIDPALAQNKTYLISVILSVFWALSFLSLFGVKISAKVNDICTAIGTIFPMLLLIALGCWWWLSGHPLEIRIASDTVIPSFATEASWVSLIAAMSSFLGMELAGVHVRDIEQPQRNFPKAVLCASAFILFSMLLGSLSIAFVIPQEEINFVSGVMQVFSRFFHLLGLGWCIPAITALIAVGSIGGMINWLISPAKGLLQAAESGFLPRVFLYRNRHGAPVSIILAQALFASLACLAFLFVPSINGFYWFLTALSTELYMSMYVLVFLSAYVLRSAGSPEAFQIPGGRIGLLCAIGMGLFGCIATIAVSFFPPPHSSIESSAGYGFMIAIGNLAALAPLAFLFLYRYRSGRAVLIR